MAASQNGSLDSQPSRPGDSSFFSSTENTSLIVSERLSHHNYYDWAQAVKVAVSGRGKLKYLNGQAPKPPTDSNPSTLQQWETENALVCSWLINAMSPSIRRTFMYLPTAKDIWEAVRESYVDQRDLSHRFDIRRRIWRSSQGSRSIQEYWFELCALWQEEDLMLDDEWVCPADATKAKRNRDSDRIMSFLAGLNSDLDDARARILSNSSLPSPREVFSELKREESRRQTMLNPPIISNMLLPHQEVSGLLGKSVPSNSSKGKPFCDHCKKPWHTKDKCWDLHGKPVDWKPRRPKQPNQRAHHVSLDEVESPSAISAVPPISKDQMTQLLDILKTLQTPSQPTASVAQKGIGPLTFLSSASSPQWIVDSGASDHMTSESNMFVTYSPLAGNSKIRTATGSPSTIAGTGDVNVSSHLTLGSVLHVPHLTCNLLSISQLTKQANCSVHFFSTHCIFQDLSSGKMIGTAKENGGLYYLDC